MDIAVYPVTGDNDRGGLNTSDLVLVRVRRRSKERSQIACFVFLLRGIAHVDIDVGAFFSIHSNDCLVFLTQVHTS